MRSLFMAAIWIVGLTACIAIMAIFKETVIIDSKNYSLAGNEAGLVLAIVWSIIMLPNITGSKVPNPVTINDKRPPKGS